MAVEPPDDLEGSTPFAEASDLDASPEKRESRSLRRRVKWLDGRAASIKNIAAVVASAVSILAAIYGMGFLRMAWPPIDLSGSEPAPTSIAAPIESPMTRLSNIRLTHGVSLGDGCIEKHWDCSRFSERDYGRLGVLVTFALDLHNLSGSTLEVVWKLFSKDDDAAIAPREVSSGPGWPLATFPVIAVDETGDGQLWIPYPSLEGRFFAEISVTGMPDESTDILRSPTFELPAETNVVQELPELEAIPTLAEG